LAGGANLYGVFFSSGTVSRNFIHGFYSENYQQSPYFFGILDFSSNTDTNFVSDNKISFEAPSSHDYRIFGIQNIGLLSGKSCYQRNTVFIKGTSSDRARTYCFQRVFKGGVRLSKNILVNLTAGSSSSHYTLHFLDGISNLESDYNDLYTNGNSIVFCNCIIFPGLQHWQGYAGLDFHSLSLEPHFSTETELDLAPGLNDELNLLLGK
jgi:hypothetical protein